MNDTLESRYLKLIQAGSKRVAELESELREVRAARNEPIAIVGAGCRLPGGIDSPESFWQALRDGVDAVSEIGPDRWDVSAYHDSDPSRPGKMYARHAGLVPVHGFDAPFFGISAREAASLDPQQRMVLEASWEALENAALDPGRLTGSRTGVFIGITTIDHMHRMMGRDLAEVDAYMASGGYHSPASGRLSYMLGLRGPSMSVDTACSSSLVAIHLACQSLRRGECDMALAGGVNCVLSPEVMVSLCKAGMLSAAGRCATFDAAADGFVRSEGCGVVVLKRYQAALADGDTVLAILRGSAVNQDGRTSGLTVPSGPSQQAVVREALSDAGVAPADVSYVEAHGTGTRLGDPIEVGALGAVFGPTRGHDRPLLVGSVKTNIGHAESAAGVAGVIKVMLALRQGEIPASLHFREANPYIPWDELPIRVAAERTPWPSKRRVAGVSSFGFSGTNCHVVLEEAPVVSPPPAAPERPAELFVLSARSDAALSAAAGRLRAHLMEHPELGAGDVAFSLATTRGAMEQRLALPATSREALLAALETASQGQTPRRAARSAAGAPRGKLAFLFTGQGAQVPGMGRELCAAWPAFREALDRCVALFDRELARPLREVIWAAPDSAEAAQLEQTGFTQPALFAMEYALVALWRSWGVTPDLVAGHSIGELVAACAAGVFSLEDAVRLVAARGRLMQALPSGGAMVSIAAPEQDVAAAVAPYAVSVSIAAVNGPGQVVIAGAAEAVAAVAADFAARGVRTKALRVSHAFHSPLMEPMLAAFARVAASITYHAPSVPVIGNLGGALAGDELQRPGYWVEHVRKAVRFADGVRALHAEGVATFVEIGPRATLLGTVPDCLPEVEPLLIASLRSGREEPAAVLEAVGKLWAAGGEVDWSGVFPAGGRRLALPTYPWQRQRHWVEVRERARVADAEDPIREWLYAPVWRSRPLVAQAALTAQTAPGHWVVLADEEGVGERLAGALEAVGATCSPLRLGAVAEGWTREALGAWWAERVAERGPVRGVVHLWSLGAPVEGASGLDMTSGLTPGGGVGAAGALDAALGRGVHSALSLVQTMAGASQGQACKLWLVTRGAMSVGAADPVVAPEQATLWGLGRVVSLEHPELWGGLIDLPAAPSEAAEQALLAQVLCPDGEDHVALRSSGRYVARLERHRPADKASRPWSTTGTALITGGLGALGLHVARWLVGRGVKHLVLTGRRGAESAEAKAAVASLEAMGVGVTVAKADVADAAAVAAVLADIDARLPPLTAVFHAAGVIDDGVLMQQDAPHLARVLAPKVQGTLVLDALTRNRPLQAFVCFSSIASVWGSGGQADYAAANAYLDAWTLARRAEGRAAYCINWGVWAGGGMASEETLTGLDKRGVRAMSPEAAIEGLSRVLEGEAAQVVVADIDWPRFREVYELGGARPFVAEMPRAEVAASTAGRAALVEELRARPAAERRSRLEHWLRETVARTLGFAVTEAVSLTTGFFDIGMDSLMAVELRNRLQAATGQSLASNLAFNYPTVSALAGHLSEILFPVADTAAPATAAPVAAAVRSSADSAVPAAGGDASQEPIAIVGIGCRFPGGASSPEAFWQLLQGATSAIREVPPERWDIDAFYDPHLEGPDKMNTRWGGFLDGIDQFDFSFFGLSRREAMAMDPMQRLVLEVAWESLEHAGIAPSGLAATATGVFFGVGNSDFHSLLLTPPDRGSTGVAASIIANRLSYLLDLRGPSVALDTACSSSLVAVHLACQSLRTGESDLALAGGVNVLLDPSLTVATSQAGMMARDGRCKTFGATADGYVRSEGCGAVVLKRLSDARRDGDQILALIRGSAVNQDGRSIGLTAPNGLAQQAVVRRALRNAGVTAGEVDYVEAHGTGTPLGDGIEVQALAQVLGEGRGPERKCGLGSVKTNIGHLEAAAGIAGLIKTTLALRHGVIPPHLLVGELNPALELDRTPFLIPTVAHPVDIRPRLAGVSSFGFGGTNAHVILEAPPEQPSSGEAGRGEPQLLVLSAKHPKALQGLAGRYAAFLERHPDASLAGVCATAASGRAHFPHRLALIADSIAALREQLAAASAGQVPAGAFHGQVGSPSAGAGALAQPAEGATTPVLPECDVSPEVDLASNARSLLEDAARLYVAGASLAWENLHAGPPPPRVALPTYSFQRQRCWLGPTEIRSYARARASL